MSSVLRALAVFVVLYGVWRVIDAPLIGLVLIAGGVCAWVVGKRVG